MAAENIEKVTPLFSEKIGARLLVVGEVGMPAKYKTEGCEFTEAQLKELGLTNALVDCGWVVTSGKVAKNAEQPIVQFNITNPAVSGQEPEKLQKVKLQAYEGISTAINKELASEGTKAGSAIVTVAMIGR